MSDGEDGFGKDVLESVLSVGGNRGRASYLRS
jgi:hypothetical protein